MCVICTMIDRDMPFPTPKELARNINEVMPTENHMKHIESKIENKMVPVRSDNQKERIDHYKYIQELRKELVDDLFKDSPLYNLRNS